MKTKFPFLLVPAIAGLVLTTPLASAQSPQDKGARHAGGGRGGRLASLSTDERSKLRTAHQKAMQDPQVRAAHERMKEARRELRNVMRPAMLKADPAVQPILEKMRPQRPDGD